MKLGIFGGTFDPPHVGHLILADEARHQLALERVLWVLTPDPPHKRQQAVSSLAVRLEMLQAALDDEAGFELCRVDIDRPPPHYAVDTMHLLRSAHPGSELVYLMGADALYDLPTWHQPEEFLAACDALGVMRRPGAVIDWPGLEAQLPGISGLGRFFDAPLLEISSSQVRARIAQGGAFRHYLPPAVFNIIQRQGLYRRG